MQKAGQADVKRVYDNKRHHNLKDHRCLPKTRMTQNDAKPQQPRKPVPFAHPKTPPNPPIKLQEARHLVFNKFNRFYGLGSVLISIPGK